MKLYLNSAQLLAKQVKEAALPEALCPLLERLDYPRRGWLKRNVHEEGTVETALQHTAKLALAAAAVPSRKWGLSPLELRRQCLIHEIPEILGTDWTPGEISETQKATLEAEQLRRVLPADFPQRQEIVRLWYAFEERGLGFCLDKMDAAVTAEYYALTNPEYKPVTEEFFQYACSKIRDETLAAVLKTVRQEASSTDAGLSAGELFPYYFEQLKRC
jgi:5'-deoxynucleotidase YfbR-like HD superfamily hydrolase